MEGDDYIRSSNEYMDALKAFLLSHEDDIAYEINDFGRLAKVFEHLFGRLAVKDGG